MTTSEYEVALKALEKARKSRSSEITTGDVKPEVNIGDIVIAHIEMQEQILDHDPIRMVPMTIVGYVANISKKGDLTLTMDDPTGKRLGRFYDRREHDCLRSNYVVLVRR